MFRWTALLLLVALAGCKSIPDWERGKKIIHYPLRANVKSLDPVMGGTQYSNVATSQVYESLFSYAYLKRPYELTPELAASMPEVSEDGLTYRFELKQGVTFHDDPCFPGGEGREVVAQDVVYSLMRMADKALTPSGWWLYQDRIVGFDAFQARMQAREAGEPFDWDAEIEGLRVTGEHTLEIELKRPFPQFLNVLAMEYASVLPRECAEYYGKEFGNHAVGTGPFMLKEFVRDSRISFVRNPEYREVHYPTEIEDEFVARGLDAPAGERVPFADGIVMTIFESDAPMWLKFRVGDLDMAQVPAEYQHGVFTKDLELRPKFANEGLEHYNLPLLDLIYRGFNMQDPIVGQGEKAKYLRQAISLALDTAEINDAFYNNAAVTYDGPIPPGLAGHESGVISPFRGRGGKKDLDKARALLRKAGYPNGEGLPPLQVHASRSGNSVQQVDMFARQLARIGVQIEGVFSSFAELDTKLKRKKAQMFNLAWGADYPDAENFLQLFYGPNEAPGSNNFNYKNPEYDALYEQARVMEPSPERTRLYEKMRDIIIRDVPAIGSMARVRFYVWNDRLSNVMPAEVFKDWFKYLDVEPRE